jgi:hypothetical protein
MARAMRRLIVPLLVIFVAAAALTLGACGGDDKSDNQGGGLTLETGSAPPAEGPSNSAQVPGATGSSGQTGGSGKSEKGSSGASGAEDIIDDTAPPATAKKKSAKKEKVSKEIADALSGKGQDQISYDAARKVCRSRELKLIRQTYKPKGKSDTDIAKAVSKEYKPKSREKAAYKGCIKGLSER